MGKESINGRNKMKCDKETNKRINDYVRSIVGSLYENKEWEIYLHNSKGEYWYIPLDESEDNVIEGGTGELMYLDTDEAIKQWG